MTDGGPAAIRALDPPATGDAREVAPGILWARLPLPYAPGHVNAFLIAENGGWFALDAGLDDAPTRAAWERLLAGPLGGRPLTRVLITHWHSDHLGLAGWLCRRFGAPLLMSETEYLHGLRQSYTPRSVRHDLQRRFFTAHGLPPDVIAEWVRGGHLYLDMMAPVPTTFVRLVAGQNLAIGDFRFRVLTMPGHSPESVLLHDPDANVLLGADQAMPGIASNIAVQTFEPDGDPLGLYLQSLDDLEGAVAAEALVLPGHAEAFFGLHDRIAEIRHTFRTRSSAIEALCGDRRTSVGDLLPQLFARPVSPTWIGFVASDLVAHLNFMAARGRLFREETDGRLTFRATEASAAGSSDVATG